MSNFTFIQVPADVTDANQLRRFLSKLVLELDTAFGNRGSESFATTGAVFSQASSLQELIEQLNVAAQDFLTQEDTDSLYEPVIKVKNTAFNKSFGTTPGTVTEGGSTTNNPSQGPITSLSQTVSDPPTQAEVQDISNKVDEILTALSGANII